VRKKYYWLIEKNTSYNTRKQTHIKTEGVIDKYYHYIFKQNRFKGPFGTQGREDIGIRILQELSWHVHLTLRAPLDWYRIGKGKTKE